MRIKVTSHLDDLAVDMEAIKKRARPELRGVVVDGIRAGNELAKQFAKSTSGTHARLYPGKFSAEMGRGLGLFGNVISGEYGPRSDGQGKLAGILENGSRNNPPHNNLARSADMIGPQFPREVGALVDKWFW